MRVPFSLFRKRIKYDLLRFFHSSPKLCSNISVCVVGSGPAGFYTAQHLIKQRENIRVDIYEKLPVPFGLIRYGVAPDHPDIKNVINAFTKIAADDRCSFYGNVNVGKDISVGELLTLYNAVVLSYGASSDQDLIIPGTDTKNVLSARTFVGWYNGLPENANEDIDLDTEVAAVIGHGNVALDVARILLHTTEQLKETDITKHALEALMKSRIRKVILIGRRGPLQVAFTIKELREMTKLPGCHAVAHPSDFEGVADLIESIPRPRKRITELMLEMVEESKKPHSELKELEFKFYRSPKAILPGPNGKVEKLTLGINKPEGTINSGKILETEEVEQLDCGLVLKSVGYSSTTIDPSIPFNNEKCIIPNKHGRALGKNCTGLYCSGWVKTGPKGVIPTTMHSSYETGEKILQDLKDGIISAEGRPDGKEICDILQKKGIKYVNFDHWKKIDAVEQERGKALGKPREKIIDVNEMLSVAGVS